jgi:predicted phosphoribosyltransferase
MPAHIFDLPAIRNRVGVFRDRAHAGESLISLLPAFKAAQATLLAIPAGGVPVAQPLVERLVLPFDLAVVSKITLPWNSEVGYGAVAFDGSVRLNEALLEAAMLTPGQVDEGIRKTRDKVAARWRRLRGERPWPDLAQCTAILVDDGVASGFTMAVAVAALRNRGARQVIVAVPTGHADALVDLAAQADAVYCANVRPGPRFAVADAYEHWTDVGDEELTAMVAKLL